MDRFASSFDYFAELTAVQSRISHKDIERVVSHFARALESQRTIYCFGNGGSAALASHMACDFGKGTHDLLPASQRLRIVSLVDNTALMTAWSNDVSYDEVFAQQIINLAQPGDIAFAISGSGNSPNVLRALDAARQQGAICVGLAGFSGGKMKGRCDDIVVVPSDSMQIIEDVHVSLCHVIFVMLRKYIRQMRTAQALAAPAGN